MCGNGPLLLLHHNLLFILLLRPLGLQLANAAEARLGPLPLELSAEQVSLAEKGRAFRGRRWRNRVGQPFVGVSNCWCPVFHFLGGGNCKLWAFTVPTVCFVDQCGVCYMPSVGNYGIQKVFGMSASKCATLVI